MSGDDKFNESNPFDQIPKSFVKLKKNSRGVNWEVKVVKGEEKSIQNLMNEAVRIHKLIEKGVIKNE